MWKKFKRWLTWGSPVVVADPHVKCTVAVQAWQASKPGTQPVAPLNLYLISFRKRDGDGEHERKPILHRAHRFTFPEVGEGSAGYRIASGGYVGEPTMVRFYRNTADVWVAKRSHDGGLSWVKESYPRQSYVCRGQDVDAIEMIGTEKQ